MAEPTPWEVLGVAAGSDLATCLGAFRAGLDGIARTLPSSHAEDRPDALARWAELVTAWRAVTARP